MTELEQAARDAGLRGPDDELPHEINLDAARKARREKQGPRPFVTFLGEKYDLPHALPADVIDMVGGIAGGDFTQTTAAMRLLLGGPVYEKLREKAIADGDPLELPDVVYLLERTLEIYEVTIPESKGSAPRS